MPDGQGWNERPAAPGAGQGGATSWGGSGSGTRAPDAPFGGWSDQPAAPDEGWSRPAPPPVVWLLASVLLAVSGLLLALLADDRPLLAGLGWLLGGPFAIALIAVYLRRDTARRALPVRVDYAWVSVLHAGAVVLALAAVVASSLRIALWVGRR